MSTNHVHMIAPEIAQETNKFLTVDALQLLVTDQMNITMMEGNIKLYEFGIN